MRKLFLSLISLLFLGFIANAQTTNLTTTQNQTPSQDEFKPSGTGIGVVFFNYKYDLTDKVTQKGAYEISRAYLGYKYDFTKTVSGKVVYDMGYDSNVKTYTGFLKIAQLDWALDPQFKVSMGLIGARHFDTQEKFWGNRYVKKVMIDEYAFGVAADLGINIEIPATEMFTFNLFSYNGEGFKSAQDANGVFRFGGNVVAKPVDGLILKLHYEMNQGKDTASTSCFSAFAGYEMKDVFRIATEYNLLNNGKDYKTYGDSYALNGLSVYGAYIVNPKVELFARYDMISSNKIGSAVNEWNYNKDGSMILGGIQYKITKAVNISANYTNYAFKNSDLATRSTINLSLGFIF